MQKTQCLCGKRSSFGKRFSNLPDCPQTQCQTRPLTHEGMKATPLRIASRANSANKNWPSA
jgi:hypothetical protein